MANTEDDRSDEAGRGAFYEAVRPHPDGRSTASRLALTAREQGFGGIVPRIEPGRDLGPASAAAIEAAVGIDVLDSVEIRADGPGAASAAVGAHRSTHTLLLLAGGSVTLNRFAVEDSRVDVLTRPMADRGDVNHVTMKAAAHNGVRIEFDFSLPLRASGGRRVRALSDLRKLRELVGKYDVPYVVSAGATSHLELRAPRELAAVGEAIGFTSKGVRAGLREWGRLAARNRDRQGGSFIEPGVRVSRYDREP